MRTDAFDAFLEERANEAQFSMGLTSLEYGEASEEYREVRAEWLERMKLLHAYRQRDYKLVFEDVLQMLDDFGGEVREAMRFMDTIDHQRKMEGAANDNLASDVLKRIEELHDHVRELYELRERFHAGMGQMRRRILRNKKREAARQKKAL